MRRRRRLSAQETKWVNECITKVCEQEGLKSSDEQYRSTAWEAFLNWYHNCGELDTPSFWPKALERISEAIYLDKQTRTSLLYRELSLNRPLCSEGEETFLDMLLAKNGDFTNGVAFFDFLSRLSWELRQLSGCILDGYTLEEARSQLNWTSEELVNAVGSLRRELLDYEHNY